MITSELLEAYFGLPNEMLFAVKWGEVFGKTGLPLCTRPKWTRTVMPAIIPADAGGINCADQRG